MYKSYYPAVLKLILGNNGTEDDAKDIFQEALIAAFRNIREKADFSLESNLQTYIYSIARLLWLQHLRNAKISDRIQKENQPFIEFEEPEPFDEKDMRMSLYQKAFALLPEDCQQIMRLTIDGVSQKDIAAAMGLRSENYIAKRKHYCKEFLIARIKEDPEYKPGIS
jgi:RNA polymerase sigma factor (sigma-70 family)